MHYKRKKSDTMSTLIIDNSSFTKFIKQNKEKVYRLAEQNTVRNKKGEIVIAKNDPWYEEDEWDEYTKKFNVKNKILDLNTKTKAKRENMGKQTPDCSCIKIINQNFKDLEETVYSSIK